MSKKIGLQEALDLMNSDADISLLMANPSLLNFLDEIQSAGIDVLKDKDNDYLHGLVILLKSCGIVGLLSGGDKEDFAFALMLLTSDAYEKIVVSLLKYAIGIAVLEELH